MKLLSRLFLFLALSNPLHPETNFILSITNIQENEKLPFSQGIQYDKKNILDFPSISSKLNSAFIYNRSYGSAGQLNTISIDGGLSSHTRIGWNNINIELPQNNSIDVSLLPIEFAYSYELYRDNLSPYGIFGQGGFINFLPFNNFNKNSMLDIFVQSFSTYGGKILLNTEKDNFSGKLGISAIYSSNNYNYIDKYGITNEAKNLDFKRYAIFSEMNYKGISFSLAHTYRFGGTGINYNYAGKQEDIFTLAGTKFAMLDTIFKLDFLNWKNTYTVPEISEDTHINNSFSLEIIKGFDFYGFSHSIKPIFKYFLIDSTKIGKRDLPEFHFIYSLNKTFNTIKIEYSSDIVYRKEQNIYYIPGITIALNVFDGIELYGSVSRGLLFPSFNDLYWPEDSFARGNPSLKPEDGIRWQTGSAILFPPFYINLCYSESYIENQIIWQPSPSIWEPRNIGKVLSRVFNITSSLENYFGPFYIRGEISFSYNYTINNDESSIYYQKRILYIPLYKWSGNLITSYEDNIQIIFSFRQVSERFINEENSLYLNPYAIFDLRFHIYFFYLAIENLFDVNYEEISAYPQPGRVYKAGVRINF